MGVNSVIPPDTMIELSHLLVDFEDAAMLGDDTEKSLIFVRILSLFEQTAIVIHSQGFQIGYMNGVSSNEEN